MQVPRLTMRRSGRRHPFHIGIPIAPAILVQFAEAAQSREIQPLKL